MLLSDYYEKVCNRKKVDKADVYKQIHNRIRLDIIAGNGLRV